MKIIVEAEDIEIVQKVVKDSCGLVLTEDQARQLFEDQTFVAEYYEFGAHDTCTCEYLNDTYAREFVGRPWPTYGEGDSVYEQFKIDFKKAAVEKGYALVEETNEL